MLTWLQDISPAQVLVALLAFPWLAVALMHAFAAAAYRRFDARAFDGTSGERAAAALKWFGEKAKSEDEYVNARASKRVTRAAKTRRIATAALEFRAYRGTPAELDAA
jgi:hypothetical protein